MKCLLWLFIEIAVTMDLHPMPPPLDMHPFCRLGGSMVTKPLGPTSFVTFGGPTSPLWSPLLIWITGIIGFPWLGEGKGLVGEPRAGGVH